jgi:hypothetical protein
MKKMARSVFETLSSGSVEPVNEADATEPINMVDPQGAKFGRFEQRSGRQ